MSLSITQGAPTLSRRLFYSHLLCALLVSFSVASYLYFAVRQELLTSLNARLAGSAATLAGSLDAAQLSALQAGSAPERAAVRERMHQFLRYNQDLGAARVLAVAANASVVLLEAQAERENAPEAAVPKQVIAPINARDYAGTAFVPNSQSSFAVSVSAKAGNTEDRLGQTRNNALLGFILAVALSLFFSRLLNKQASTVVGSFVERFRQVAGGRFDARVPLMGDDEFGRLAVAFNDMALKLQTSLGERDRTLEQLQQARDRLERNVRDRTQELERLNVLLREEHEQRARFEAGLAEAAATDPLTKLLNRRAMLELLEHVATRMRNNARTCCFVICDIDHFKLINDQHGHAVGDTVLAAVAGQIRQELRSDEAAARWGGEEFLLLWPDQGLSAVEQRANRVRELLNSKPLAAGVAKVSACFGIAELKPGESVDQCLIRADKAMYRAKAAGRNRVCVEA